MQVYLLLISLVLLVKPIFGQSIICVRPDSMVQDTIYVKKFVQIGLDGKSAASWGQIANIRADSVHLKVSVVPYGATMRWIALNQITSLQKSSIFSSPIARYAYGYALRAYPKMIERFQTMWAQARNSKAL